MEYKVEIITQAEQQKKERILKNKESLGNVLECNDMKCNDIHIIGIPEGEESKHKIEKLFEEMMTKNFPYLVKDKDKSRKLREFQETFGPKEAYTETHHN